jgi:hypothetical protein
VKKNVEFKLFKTILVCLFQSETASCKQVGFFFYHIGVNLCGIAQFQQLKIASLQSKNPYFFIEVKGIV